MSTVSGRKNSRRRDKVDFELVNAFWGAPAEAFFSQDVVAAVTNRCKKTLECDRWRGKGIPYRKCSGRVLYRKCDIVAWLENHRLVSSTSEYGRCPDEQ